MMEYWHVSPRHNEERIDREGLLPHWELLKETGTLWFEPVHISEGYAVADFICDLHEVEEVVIYKVDLTDLDCVREGFDGPGTLAVFQPICQDRLTKIGYQDAEQNWTPLER